MVLTVKLTVVADAAATSERTRNPPVSAMVLRAEALMDWVRRAEMGVVRRRARIVGV